MDTRGANETWTRKLLRSNGVEMFILYNNKNNRNVSADF